MISKLMKNDCIEVSTRNPEVTSRKCPQHVSPPLPPIHTQRFWKEKLDARDVMHIRIINVCREGTMFE